MIKISSFPRVWIYALALTFYNRYMTKFGYTLFCESNDPKDLVRQAVLAEEAGFDFLVISDHFHPWLPEHHHSGFAWSILGAVAQATSKIKLATMVTRPIVRYHPALIAQAAATVAVLSEGRFTLGLGAGERLNEHVVGKGWPPVHVRHQMLREAIEIIRLLWQGDYVSYQGKHFTLEDAKLFDLPKQPIDMFVAAGGPNAARLAGEMSAGLCATEPKAALIDDFAAAGGDKAATWSQIVLSWATTEKQGLQLAHDQFRFGATGWKVQAELPNPVNFAAATKTVRPEDLAGSIPAGADPTRHQAGIGQYQIAGFEHIAVAYPGPDKEGFMQFWQHELAPILRPLGKTRTKV